MLIVLEGVDGSGKTTLANLLSYILRAKVIHATRETPNTAKWFKGIIDESKTKNIIADRFFWGQFAYQNKDERHLSLRSLGFLESYLKTCGGVIVYVTAPDDVVMDRLKGRGEELSVPLDVLKSRYQTLVDISFCPVIKYDTSKGEVINNGCSVF